MDNDKVVISDDSLICESNLDANKNLPESNEQIENVEAKRSEYNHKKSNDDVNFRGLLLDSIHMIPKNDSKSSESHISINSDVFQ